MNKNSNVSAPIYFYRLHFIFVVIIFSVIGLLAYSNTLTAPFQFDDVFIYDNSVIQQCTGLQGIWDYWPSRFLTFLSFSLNFQACQFSTFGYHCVNLALHIFNTVIVYFFILTLFLTPRMLRCSLNRYARQISFWGSIVFLVHPLQTQAVTYVYQRSTLLATLCCCVALVCYLRFRIHSDLGWQRSLFYFGAYFFAGIGMFTKETAFITPLLIFLIELCFFDEPPQKRWRYSYPFLLLLLILPAIFIIQDPYLMKNFTRLQSSPQHMDTNFTISRGDYLLTQFRVLMTYLRLLILPVAQKVDYAYRVSQSLLEADTFFAFLFLVILLRAAFRLLHRFYFFSFCIIWFFVTLAVESSFVPLNDVIFEHRLYLPMISFSCFLPMLIYMFVVNKKMSERIATIVLCGIVIVYALSTSLRNEAWKSRIILWDDAIQKSSFKPRMYINRGVGYLEKWKFDRAISDFAFALGIEIDPRLITADSREVDHFIQGGSVNYDLYSKQLARMRILYEKNDFQDELAQLKEILDLNIHQEIFWNEAGLAYDSLRDYKEALVSFGKALMINPGFAQPYLNLGNIFLRLGDKFNKRFLAERIASIMYRAALIADPRCVEGYDNLVFLLVRQCQIKEAIVLYEKAILKQCTNGRLYNNLAILYYQDKQYGRARFCYGKSKALGFPQNKEFEKNLIPAF